VRAHARQQRGAQQSAGHGGAGAGQVVRRKHTGAAALADGLEEQQEEGQFVGRPHHAGQGVQGDQVDEVRRYEPQRRQGDDAQRADHQQRARAAPAGQAAERCEAHHLGEVRGRYEQDVAGVGEAQLVQQVRGEEGAGHLHGELHREREQQQATASTRGHALPGEAARRAAFGTARCEIGLGCQAAGRVEAAHGCDREQEGEGCQHSRPDGALQHHATRHEPSQLGQVHRPGPVRPIGSAQPGRHETPDPGIPGWTGSHPGAPVQGHEGEDGGRGQRSTPGGNRERQVERTLQGCAGGHPAAVRAEPAHAVRGGQLQAAAGEQGYAPQQPRADRRHAKSQREGGNIGLPDADHEAVADAVATDGGQVAPQPAGPGGM